MGNEFITTDYFQWRIKNYIYGIHEYHLTDLGLATGMITNVIELVPDEPTSTGGKEHERIETKNNRKRN